jgi:hypothetical protein
METTLNSKYFYEELSKMMNADDDIENDENLCKITIIPLEDEFVTLECGHKFNYDALYTEIYQQKCVFSTYTLMSVMKIVKEKFLNTTDCTYFIRCPYCRNVQFSLIPSKEGYKNVYGINSNELTNTDIPFLINYPPGTFVHKNHIFKWNGHLCDYPNCPKIQNQKTTHFSKLDKYYCPNHMCYGITCTKEIEKKEQSDAKLLAKKAKEDAKLLAKMALKKEKEDAKLLDKKAKEEAKLLAKMALKKEKEDSKLVAKKAKEDAKLEAKKSKVKNA